MKSALIVYGGWDGHQPEETSKIVSEALSGREFSVSMETDLDVFLDQDRLRQFDLIIPNWTMGNMTFEQGKSLKEVIESGIGLAGWHGGAGDAFRDNCEFQIMIGGQFVGHPGNMKDYTVDIINPDHEITKGLSSFPMHSEQYYMHIDPAVEVIAATKVNQPTDPWLEGTTMPVAWVRPWGKARVFYSALGHDPSEFKGDCLELLLRGLTWAAK
ncbi:ThuA domain-containing protein [Rubellicoccus peritrichatus]|uniref:ThuA domain-containing protein n=1 Tax=Rubellicoccus peritrichatus TaxID=3080537 RepID=A0AAQ3LG59_9BACT|nr:ThuA domain-containing protein [Puniceicoccus sp. CR14]WOO43228.1 ThuA domain-containing protein [Puniceicoccus sp. CR14]